jgi:RNA polymerase sigma-70 factor (ECF subfamily)
VERAYREHAVRLLALLARELRSLDLAEEALQEAHVAALAQWAGGGVPANPAAWLLTVARRRARDRLRREATLARKLPLLIVDEADPEDEDEDDVTTIADERLRLVFTACHPALAPPARVALTLRYAGGLTTREIARLFLVSEPTMAARLTRAKRKIAEAGIPYRVPADADLPERLDGVLAVVYLVFTEGYAPGAGARLVRTELCEEAIRLGRLLLELMPDEPEVRALLALMLLQHARRDARVAGGRLVRLPEQDRGRWRADEIAEGRALLGAGGPAGPYRLQALIAAEHAAGVTDWRAVAALYERLEAVRPSPAVRLNRAVAVAEADGPEAGLALLSGLDDALPRSHQLAAARAELLARLGRREAALRAFDRALELAGNDVVRAHLAERRSSIADH